MAAQGKTNVTATSSLGLTEIQSRLVALETRRRQLVEDISAPLDPTAFVAPTARQSSSPVIPAARQPSALVAPAAR